MEFLKKIKNNFCFHELKLEKIFHLSSFFEKLKGFKDCHFGTINARYVSRYQRESRDLVPLRTHSKSVGGNFFAILIFY